jgi:hypothetical protein
MSTLTSSPPRIGRPPPTNGATRRRPTDHWKRRPSVGRRVATAGLLAVLGITLLLSVPALRPVLRAIREISPGWIAVAIALELASCVSFVIIFRLFFDRVGPRDARALAWTEMASGALLPGGGVGGYAIGGWLLHLTGAPTRWIVRRSGGLFFLTSAVNSATVISAGLLLLAGAAGPHDFARAALPALLAGAATLVVLALPRMASRRDVPVWVDGFAVGVRDAQRTARQPSWRLLGALGYPGCRQEGALSTNGGQVLAGQGRETARLGVASGFARPAPPHRLGVRWRLAAALLASGCVLTLFAPNQSSASNLLVPREIHAGSPQSHNARHAQVPPHLTAAVPSRPAVPSIADGASLAILLVLALNSAAMVIRLVTSPPSWMKG